MGATLGALPQAPFTGAERRPLAGAQRRIRQDKTELAADLQIVIDASGHKSCRQVILRRPPSAAGPNVPALRVFPERVLTVIGHRVINHPRRIAHQTGCRQRGQTNRLRHIRSVPMPDLVAFQADVFTKASVQCQRRILLGIIRQIRRRRRFRRFLRRDAD